MSAGQGGHGGAESHGRRFEYDSEQGEDTAIEQGSASLGTPAAGAGAAPNPEAGTHLPPGAGHQHLGSGPHADFTYRSDAGEDTAIEEGTELTEEGEAAAREG